MSALTTHKRALAIGVATACVALGWISYTQHAWEDFFITFRVVRNWSQGLGLVYNEGERVQVYSSPVGIMVLGFADWVAGGHSEAATLFCYRGANLLALASANLLLWKAVANRFRHSAIVLLTFGLVLLDAKAVDCVMGGMETGYFLLFMALSLCTLLSPRPRQGWSTGVGFAGLMLTRPDAIIYILALVVGALSFLAHTHQERTTLAARLARASAFGAMLYLPWLVWAWTYYGNPVPHSVVAKALMGEPKDALRLAGNALAFPLTLLFEKTQAWRVFSPAYVGEQEVASALQVVWVSLAWVASVAWLVPKVRGATRMLSFLTFCANFYLLEVVPNASPWYFPPAAVAAYVTLGLLVDQCFEHGRASKVTFSIALTTAVLGQAIAFLAVGIHTRVQQRVIEDGVRAEVGAWLKENACSESDTVLLEPLGYVGFYSQLKMIDYLGLASRKMVALRQTSRTEWAALPLNGRPNPALELDPRWLDAFEPDWLVLRPAELQGGLRAEQERLMQRYKLRAVFDQTAELGQTAVPFGKHTLGFYQTYWVLQRADLQLCRA